MVTHCHQEYTLVDTNHYMPNMYYHDLIIAPTDLHDSKSIVWDKARYACTMHNFMLSDISCIK